MGEKRPQKEISDSFSYYFSHMYFCTLYLYLFLHFHDRGYVLRNEQIILILVYTDIYSRSPLFNALNPVHTIQALNQLPNLCMECNFSLVYVSRYFQDHG